MWDGLDEDIRNTALTKLEVVQEILTGYRDGHPAFAREGEPRSPFGPGFGVSESKRCIEMSKQLSCEAQFDRELQRRVHDGEIQSAGYRMIITTCTADQILAAARDFTPIYYERYMIDKHNKPPEVQQAAIDGAHYFYSLSAGDRRAYSEIMATNVADPMTLAWPNWAKIFFNNKGVAAHETDACAHYPPDDQSV
jgi:hypothetical protein